ncbi:TonB-dependent siderophore receptor [Steroidobacter sp. S1-65]|uniref:TonB-dependent siderophore receptor n=1 Tax=Steroidobacter gossypii TaxID=2805490 RepID=A0ABS1WV88_9GAMM|nr:TonB-dependent receptor [Steroidobacter gossypii]MBM0104887.1 TonB-dependent siderophore receptor [Steroidobacter gossypii]
MKTIVAAIAISLSYASATLSAERADPKCHLDVNSAPLEEMLLDVGRQCGVQILYYSELTAGHTAPRLTGEYAVADALRRLLQGTDLAFRHVNATTLEIKRSDAIVRSTHRAGRSSAASKPDIEEVVVIGTTEDLVATRTETPLREIPQSISIMSGEQMRQQGALNIFDAMQDAVGVSTVRWDSFFLELHTRGFQISSFMLDGGGNLRGVPQWEFIGAILFTPDLGEFDRIEVLRGSNALFGADANPAGTINLIRKRPLADTKVHFSATAGSWENYRQEIDVTGPITEDGALRGRMVASNASREYFYKNADDRRQSIYGVVDYDLTDDLVVTLGGSYLKSRGRPFVYGGPPSYTTASTPEDPKLPRDLGIAFDWSRWDTRVAEAFFRLDHAFGDDSRLRLSATYLDNSASYRIGYLVFIDGATRLAYGTSQYTLEPVEQQHWSVEGTFTGAGEWWGHRVEWALGADLMRNSSSTDLGIHDFRTDIDPYNFDPTMPPSPARNFRTMSDDVDVRIGGAFASLRAQLTNPWFVTAGLRVSSQRLTDRNVYRIQHPTEMDFEQEYTKTPYFGTLYKLNSTWSLYASYADIFAHNGGARRRRDLSLIDAIQGVTLEAGIKGALGEGALNSSLAVYKTVQRGIAVSDRQPAPVPRCCYRASGRLETTGVDLELSGHIGRDWLIGAGYTYNGRERVVLQTQPTPRHLLKAWTDYPLPGAWHRWTIGGSLHAKSTLTPRSQFAGQKSYAVLNPRVSYRFDEHWQAALTVNNVFDEYYYEDFLGAFWYGEPRNYFLRIDARF